MEGFNVLAIFFPLLFYSNLFHVVSTGSDTLTPNQFIIDGETLISSGGSFELGFFSPNGSTNRYLGIWFHNIADQTVVWVANPISPITGTAGVLNLTSYGDLIVQDQAGHFLWSTGTSGMTVTAKLLDSGNLVILIDSKSIVWQSFDHPSDTLLPGMKLGWDLRTNLERRLSSWTNFSDPSPGTYSLAMDLRGFPEMYLWNGSEPLTRITGDDLFTFRFVAKDDEVYYAYEISNQSIVSRLVVTEMGVVQHLLWLGNEWTVHWFGPRDQCDDYDECGAYGVCNTADSALCNCLRGFMPNKLENWNLRDFSDGCIRRTPLGCPVGDGFLKVENLRLPETSKATVISKNMVLDVCRAWCLNDVLASLLLILEEKVGVLIGTEI